MARNTVQLDPSLAWVTNSCVVLIGLLILRLALESFPGTLGVLPPLVAGVAAVQGLLAAGVTGAMLEPPARTSKAETVPLRFRASLALLGLCPPPGNGMRLLLIACAAAAVPVQFAGGRGLAFMLLVMGGVLLFGFTMRGSRDIMQTSLSETGFILATDIAGIWGMFASFDESAAVALQGGALMALVTILHAQRVREVVALRWAELNPGLPPPPALDLSRYALSVARKGPEARPALPPGVDAQLVGSGSFKVDAAKMLDKLRSYQLSDPADFVCAWLRCAAASGAKAIELNTGALSLELRFDGRAFSAAELSRPYQALVEGDGKAGLRGRHFAYGLLGLYKLSPTRVVVTSRGPEGVAVMNAGAGSPPDPGAAPEGTFIRVEWPLWAAFWRSIAVASRARERFGLGPARLAVDGNIVPAEPAQGSWGAEPWQTFRSGAWRGVYRRNWVRESRIRLHVLGTLIEEVVNPSRSALEAWLAHDGLDLDISQSSVVNKARLKAVFSRLSRAARSH